MSLSIDSLRATEVVAPYVDGAGNRLTGIPQFVRRNADEHGDRTAFRVKAGAGGWSHQTWADVHRAMNQVAAGILDLERLVLPERTTGQVGFVMGANSPEHFIAEWALQAVGLTAFPLFETMSVQEMCSTLADYPGSIAFSGSAAATDRLIEACERLAIQRIVQWGTEPVVDDPRVVTFGDLRARGARFLEQKPNAVDEKLDAVSLDDIACIILTSGTTGTSKGVLGSHRYMLDIAQRYQYVYGAEPHARYLSYLPAAFSVEQYNGLTLAAALPLDVAFSSTPAAAAEEFVESQASMKYLGPRQWEELRATLPPDLLADENAIREQADEIRAKLGLAFVKGCVTAGGSLSPVVVEFYQLLNLPIRNVYGFAEVGIITSTRDGQPSSSVGTPIPSAYGSLPLEVRISDDGELQVRGGVSCSGYFGGKHKLALTPDGWLASGDAGVIEGGALRILDRLANIQRLPDGSTFAPQPIETAAMSSPYIASFIIIGGNGKDSRIGALIQINEEAVRNGLALPQSDVPYDALVMDSRVTDLVIAEVRQLNESQPASQRVSLIALLPKPLRIEDGELTRSSKVRRTAVVERYQSAIDSMYSLRKSGESITESQDVYVGRDGEGEVHQFAIRASAV